MPVYKVKSPAGERLVKAGTKSTAINHVIREQITAEPLTADEVADAAAAGVKIEVAAAPEKADGEQVPQSNEGEKTNV